MFTHQAVHDHVRLVMYQYVTEPTAIHINYWALFPEDSKAVGQKPFCSQKKNIKNYKKSQRPNNRFKKRHYKFIPTWF